MSQKCQFGSNPKSKAASKLVFIPMLKGAKQEAISENRFKKTQSNPLNKNVQQADHLPTGSSNVRKHLIEQELTTVFHSNREEAKNS